MGKCCQENQIVDFINYYDFEGFDAAIKKIIADKENKGYNFGHKILKLN